VERVEEVLATQMFLLFLHSSSGDLRKGGSIAAAGLSHWRRVVLRNADGRCGDTKEPMDCSESLLCYLGVANGGSGVMQ
jgi:hypothetical protein